MLRRELAALALLGLVFVSDTSAAPPPTAACCVNTTSRLDSIVNPVTGGDERIFTRRVGAPTVVFLIGNHQSMQDFVTQIPDGTANACPIADPFNTAFAAAGGMIPADADADFGTSYFFDPAQYYVTYGTRLAVKTTATAPNNDLDPAGLLTDFTGVEKFVDAATICARLNSNYQATRASRPRCTNASCSTTSTASYTMTAAEVTACQNCINTYGWYRGPHRVKERADTGSSDNYQWGFGRTTYLYALRGNFLNQRPPKFVTARKVVKDTINTLSNVRLGVATFGNARNSFDPANLFASDSAITDPVYGTAGAPSVGPSCPQSFPMDSAAFNSVKTHLIKQINNVAAYRFPRVAGWEFTPTQYPNNTGLYFTNGERSVGEALFSLGGFFSNQRPAATLAAAKAGQWWQWFRRDNTPAGYPAGDSSAASACIKYTGGACTVSGDSTTMWVKAGSPFAVDTTNDSFCWSCGSAAVIVLVDGVPYADNSVPAGRMLQMVSGALPAEGTDTTNGINFCNRYSVCGGTFQTECSLNNAAVATGAGAGAAACTKTHCDPACGVEGPVANNRNFMDDTSFFMSHYDLRPDIVGPQNVNVYTIGFGSNSPMLQSIAEAGQGRFYLANDATGLQNALQSAVNSVMSASTGFAAASVPSIQTSNAELTAVLPRMTPRTDANWRGELWRFDQFNEFVADVDKNSDGDKDDIFVVDADGDIVIENGLGAFLKANALTPANPAWEARRKLIARNGWSSTVATRRKIWTVLDDSADNAFTSADTLVEVVRTNTGLVMTSEEAKLGAYFGVLGTGFCPTAVNPGTFLTKTGRTAAQMATMVGATPWPGAPSQANFDTICVRGLIDFIRGRDVTDEDGDGDRDETAESVLADIFHSSPAIVQPPIDKFLCELSAHNQCVVTLFGKANGTAITPLAPLAANPPSYNGCTTERRDAYDTYRFYSSNGTREKVILVGANDGMLHAFRDERFNGTYTGTGCPATPSYVYNAASSGQEAWAFIPPSLLPRLHEQLSAHVYLLDGDVMIRDIWADGSGSAASPDGVKQWDEFHTLAVVAEGRGGNHYSAMEVAFDSSTGNVLDAPRFRWMFPQPCSEEAAEFGKTLLSISPKPPPIGPILLDNSTALPSAPPGAINRMTYRDAAGASNGVPIPTAERWVVAVTGGWEPSLDKGRGLFILDAWQPQVNSRTDNLLWKMSYEPAAASQQGAPKAKMTHSIAAPVALVDYSGNEGELGVSDGFFDTAVVGDTHGQLWVARMSRPGRVNTTTKLIDNWAGGRAFEQGGSESNMRLKHPFFYTATSVISPTNGALRVLIGTGNRYAIQDLDAGACRFDNPQACSLNACGTVQSNQTMSKNGIIQVTSNQMRWGDRTFLGPIYTKAAAPVGDICGVAGGAISAFADNTQETINTCPVSFGDVQRLRAECRQDASGNFSCNRTDVLPTNLDDLATAPTAAVLSSLSKNRFYGFWAYGGKGSALTDSTFNEEWNAAATATQRSASYFDTQRLTDQTGSATPRRELVNVSSTTCTTSACVGSLATDDDGTASQWGWALEYEGLSHRTATSAIVFGGCTMWNTSFPTATPASICTAAGAGTGRVYQADFITGAPNCAASFLSGANYSRYQQRNLVAPPPEPTSLVQVSQSGQVKLGIMMAEPGASQATVYNQSTQTDVLQTHYELQVNRRLHNCRHQDKTACAPSPP